MTRYVKTRYHDNSIHRPFGVKKMLQARCNCSKHRWDRMVRWDNSALTRKEIELNSNSAFCDFHSNQWNIVWALLPAESSLREDNHEYGRKKSMKMHLHVAQVSLTRQADWSPVNSLQNECDCHLLAGNMGERGASVQTYEKFMRK
jgi:hypothetical protein